MSALFPPKLASKKEVSLSAWLFTSNLLKHLYIRGNHSGA